MRETDTAGKWQLNTPYHTAPGFRHVAVYVISVTWQHMGSKTSEVGRLRTLIIKEIIFVHLRRRNIVLGAHCISEGVIIEGVNISL